MPISDVFSERKKHNVMADTWGHFYPEPGKKYYGEMTIAVGEYRDEIIVKSDFPGLENSPQQYALEHSIFGMRDFDVGVYTIKCCLWFYKTSSDAYLGKPIGKIINILTNPIIEDK